MKRLVLLMLIASVFFLVKGNPETIHQILSQFQNGPKKELFKVYHFLFNKEYDLNSEEGLRRYKIFKENLAFIESVNAEKRTYRLGINQFADMTNEEYREKMLMDPEIFKSMRERSLREVNFDKEADEESAVQVQDRVKVSIDTDINWTDYLLPPRAQLNCGSCWAFATAGIMEAGWAIKTGKKLYLSPQQLIDCDTRFQHGCHGGLPLYSMNFTKKWGMCTEATYPYMQMQGRCRMVKPCGVVNTGVDYCTTIWYNYDLPQKPCTIEYWLGLLSQGPVAVGVDASAQIFQFYFDGVMDNYECKIANHAVVAFAWEKVNQVISIRNSWGPNWGEKGTFRIRYRPEFQDSCFITMEAVLPLFK